MEHGDVAMNLTWVTCHLHRNSALKTLNFVYTCIFRLLHVVIIRIHMTYPIPSSSFFAWSSISSLKHWSNNIYPKDSLYSLLLSHTYWTKAHQINIIFLYILYLILWRVKLKRPARNLLVNACCLVLHALKIELQLEYNYGSSKRTAASLWP